MGNYDVGPFKSPTPGPRKRSTTDLSHQSGKDFTGPGEQIGEAVWNDGRCAAQIGRELHPTTSASFQRARGGAGFTQLDSFATEYEGRDKATNTRVQKDADDEDDR